MAHQLSVETPQFAVPFSMEGGDVKVVEQDSTEDRYQNVKMALAWEPGERLAVPEYGVADQALQENGADVRYIMNQVQQFEPDVDLDMIAHAVGQMTGEQIIDVDIFSADEGSRNG